MKRTRREREVLVIAPDEDGRERLCALLPGDVRGKPIRIEDLSSAAEHVDALGAVVLLRAAGGEAGIAELESLRSLQAGRTVFLMTEDLPDPLIELAIARLSPVAVAAFPPPAPVLRLMLDRALPLEGEGKGALPGQRSASALLGVSQAIYGVIEQIKQVAASRISVMVLGETGTGKELVARAIHQQSPRSSGPFLAVNCSALPDALLESELFGFERGAFTGAQRAKPGLFEQASGGTFFLDEIGDTSPALQAKLLRVLESMEIRRLGGNETRSIDVRIVSATHRDVKTAVADGTFRQDLYFRLNTATITIPPLRRRRVDVPFLAQHFAERFGEEHARRITLDEDFLKVLERRDFPGNVRELRNAVERAIALAKPGEVLSARHLEDLDSHHSYASVPRVGSLKARIEQVEAEMIGQALDHYAGNRTKVAEALGVSRVGLRQKMKRLNLEAKQDR